MSWGGPSGGHLLQNSPQQLQTLISCTRRTSSRPTLEIRMMSAACSTWGSSWEIIKCVNQRRSRWSYPDTARSSMNRKAQLPFDLQLQGIVVGGGSAFPRGPIQLRPWCFSLAVVSDPQPLCAAKPRVHSTMWNAQGCEVTVGSHLTQKTGICQTFFHQQTIPKNVPVSNQFRWGHFGWESDELVLGIRVLFGHMGARVRQLWDILIFGMLGGLCKLATEIRDSQFWE